MRVIHAPRNLVEANPDALDRVSEYYTPLNERIGADLAGFDVHELGAVLRFIRAAQRSTEAEIRRL